MDENINEILDLYYEKYPDAVDFVTMPDYYEKKITIIDAMDLIVEAYKKNKYYAFKWNGSLDPESDVMILKNG